MTVEWIERHIGIQNARLSQQRRHAIAQVLLQPLEPFGSIESSTMNEALVGWASPTIHAWRHAHPRWWAVPTLRLSRLKWVALRFHRVLYHE
jgi:hypothetical protein